MYLLGFFNQMTDELVGDWQEVRPEDVNGDGELLVTVEIPAGATEVTLRIVGRS